jgi:D-alanyl-lipoteichoic acid acyltransferase DltB (MBOAT superfamily)
MLFGSLFFLLAFLPASLLGLALAERLAPRWRLPYLVALSLLFYGWWDPRFAPLLAASVTANWLVGAAFARTARSRLIPAAIAVNLLLLGVFKYLDFFAGLAAVLSPGWTPPRFDLALPIGISFFTFQHIMYLTDLRAGRAEPVGLLRYALYVAFFPRVLAGPLVRPAEVMGQFDRAAFGQPDTAERFARGMMLLTFGLAKKAFLGDPLGAYVDPVYAGIAAGSAPTVVAAWQATLAYAFQLYFDFSGYTDMALGLALLFGVGLPQNFDAPYRAASIQDFWRRWHITLSNFLRDYLYIPFGGSRAGLPRQLLALVATMGLGGLWHGAGLTFVAWGLAHGAALGAHVLWRRTGRRMPEALGWALTFAFVVLAWVPFRAPDFAAALAVYGSLLGLAPWGRPEPWAPIVIAGLAAILGPKAFDLAGRLPPSRWIAVAVASLLVAVLLRVGNDANQDFIYQQF